MNETLIQPEQQLPARWLHSSCRREERVILDLTVYAITIAGELDALHPTRKPHTLGSLPNLERLWTDAQRHLLTMGDLDVSG